jgi:hypothetical protein
MVDQTWIRSDHRGARPLAKITSVAGPNQKCGHSKSVDICRDYAKRRTLIGYGTRQRRGAEGRPADEIRLAGNCRFIRQRAVPTATIELLPRLIGFVTADHATRQQQSNDPFRELVEFGNRGIQHEVRILRQLVGRIDAGKRWQHAGAGLGV